MEEGRTTFDERKIPETGQERREKGREKEESETTVEEMERRKSTRKERARKDDGCDGDENDDGDEFRENFAWKKKRRFRSGSVKVRQRAVEKHRSARVEETRG